jgi:hypothetical protein
MTKLMDSIEVRYEAERGCGFRKPGGMYLVADGPNARCGKLPFELKPCETCETLGLTCALTQSRGWTWIEADALFATVTCPDRPYPGGSCPAAGGIGRAGLLWIGAGAGYPEPGDWTAEAQRMGVSRRIPPRLPKGFELGKTWAFVAHPRVFVDPCGKCVGKGKTGHFTEQEEWVAEDCPQCEGEGRHYRAGIFHAFRPKAIEYVVDEKRDTDKKLKSLAKRGVTLVRVRKDKEADRQMDLTMPSDAAVAAGLAIDLMAEEG